MTNTVTITHHQTKPEYQWEIVVPEEATVMMTEDRIGTALTLLGFEADGKIREEIESLPNGESRSVEAKLDRAEMKELQRLSVKTK